MTNLISRHDRVAKNLTADHRVVTRSSPQQQQLCQASRKTFAQQTFRLLGSMVGDSHLTNSLLPPVRVVDKHSYQKRDIPSSRLFSNRMRLLEVAVSVLQVRCVSRAPSVQLERIAFALHPPRAAAMTFAVLSKKDIAKKMEDRREEGLQQKIGEVCV